MTSNKQIHRNKWLHIRLTEPEFNIVMASMKRTTDRKISTYTRKLILGKPVRILVRDSSLDQFVCELSALKKELSAIGNNFNQVVHRLNAAKNFQEARAWMPIASTHQRRLLEKMDFITNHLNTLSKKWYPGS